MVDGEEEKGRRIKSAPTDTVLLIITRVVRKHPVSVDSWYIPGFSNLTMVQMSSQYSTSSSSIQTKEITLQVILTTLV